MTIFPDNFKSSQMGLGLLLSVAMAALTGCGSLSGPGVAKQGGTYDLHGLSVRRPAGKDWKHVQDQNGQHFILLRDGLADYVVLYTVTSPMDRNFSSVEQLFARLNTDPALDYETLDISTFRGVPVIRFSTHTDDDGTGYELIRRQLQMSERPEYPRYYASTRGIMMLNPERSGSYVTIGCTRTSYHGFIGSHFEDVSEQFFDRFVADNVEASSAEVGQMVATPADLATSVESIANE